MSSALKWMKQRQCCFAFILTLMSLTSAHGFTDPSDPQVVDMDKEEARLNELNVRLSQINETFTHLKRIKLTLEDNKIVKENSFESGSLILDWKKNVQNMLTSVSLAVTAYLDVDRDDALGGMTPESLEAELDQFSLAIKSIQTYQTNARHYYGKIEKVVVSVNEIFKKTEMFDEAYLTSTAGSGYEEFVLQVNDYNKKIKESLISLNTALENLSYKAVDDVVSNLINAVKNRNTVYALGFDNLNDVIVEAGRAVIHAEIILEYDKQHQDKVDETKNYLNSGRISKAKQSKEAALNIIDETMEAYISKLEDPESNPTEKYNALILEWKSEAIEEVNVAFSDYSNISVNILADRFIRYLSIDVFGNPFHGLKRMCSENASEKRRAKVNCKKAKELSLFIDKDLTILTESESERVNSLASEDMKTRTIDDIVKERIELLEYKLSQVYVVEK